MKSKNNEIPAVTMQTRTPSFLIQWTYMVAKGRGRNRGPGPGDMVQPGSGPKILSERAYPSGSLIPRPAMRLGH